MATKKITGGSSASSSKNKTYKVQSNGKAPSGLKVGDDVVTGGGTYRITGVNDDGSYKSAKVGEATTSTYKGTYANAGSTGSSGNPTYSPTGTGSTWDQNVDYSMLGAQQMATGASAAEIYDTIWKRYNKAATTEGLTQYVNDDFQRQMWDYYNQALANEKAEAKNNYKEDFEEQYDGEKPTYEGQYDPAIKKLLSEILNREDFSYSAKDDPLYQQYAAMYEQQGDRAMRNTMAEAAASAGGMNSYAITAAQQANNYYNSQLNYKIPELYQLAYEMYLQDKESKVQDLGILQNLDSTQYNRYRDTMQDYYSDKNFAYGLYKDAITQGNWEQNFAYNQAVNDRNFYYNAAQDTINNEWRGKEWDNTLSQQEIANNRYDNEWNHNNETSAKQEASSKAFALLELGQMPPAELLQAAGIDEAYATAYLKGIKEQMNKVGSTSSGGSSKSSSSSKKTGNDDVVYDDVETGKTQYGDDITEHPNYNNGSIIGLGLGPISTDMLAKLATRGAIVGDGKGNYKWANGWSVNNYKERLELLEGNGSMNLMINNLLGI